MSKIIKGLKINSRRKEIEKLVDPDGGNLDKFEADGLAIFEQSIGGKVSESLEKGVDAYIFGNKRVSHFGTGGRALDEKSFNKWMEGAFKKHFRDKSIDYYLIDIRKMTQKQKETVQNAVNNMGEEVAKKTYIIK
ncbi:hypothetical protein AAG747_21025 [Rapidithrix thailandica]|uniref:Uncharacterized protein n=1 Tax=Rapidithrix thailandica TaxID=413964 RepID=A0AAW9SF53_9BACT